MKNSQLLKLKNSILLCLLCVSLVACKDKTDANKDQAVNEETMTDQKPFFKLSLAQWSLHVAVNDGSHDPMDFAEKANELGFEGLEYVSQLYTKQIEDMGLQTVLDILKAKSETFNMDNVLIMVDHEGDLSDPDESKRNDAVEKHKKWIDAADFLGCHSIRVNTFGTNDPEKWVPATVDGLTKLSTYAATKNINVIAENHGWLSSDADLLVQVLKTVNMDNCGTLPDFGNWCIKRQKGERWGGCLEEYPDMYKGIELMMPFAKGVSAKSYDFDADGNETKIDYAKMLAIVKKAGFDAYIGVEYEGKKLPEEEGIKATRDLLLKAAKDLK